MSHSQDTPNKQTDKDKEVLLILNELQANAAAQKAEATADGEDAPVASEPVVQLTAAGVRPVAETPAEPSVEPETAPPPKRNPFGRLFCALIPQRGDGGLEFFRKVLFAVALMTLISSAVYLIHDAVWIPTQNQGMNEELEEIFHRVEDPTEEEHREIMEALYAKNDDFRAWLTYEASEGDDFLQISYPVVYSGDNDYYLEHDFNKNYNKNGTLFFDERNTYTLTSAENKVSIIYGHNMLSGQMFAHLNRFLNGVSYAKAAPTMTLDTFFGVDEYKVFAIVLIDANATKATEFNYLRTSFANDLDFLNYINQVRARSLYNYDSVSLTEDDELLVLSTCTNSSTVHMEEGRLAVFARKVRVGEKATVDTAKITRNDNVIMPYAWYVNQEMTPHPFYGGRYEIPQATMTTTRSTESQSTRRPTANDDFQSVMPTSPPPVEVVIGTGNIIPPSGTTTRSTTGTKTGGTTAGTTSSAAATTTGADTTTAATTTTTATTAAPTAANDTDAITTASDAEE